MKFLRKKFNEYKKRNNILDNLSVDPIKCLLDSYSLLKYPSMIAYSLIQNESTKSIGNLILIKKLSREKFFEFSYLFVSKTSFDLLAKYCQYYTILTLSRVNPKQFTKFIKYIIDNKLSTDIESIIEASQQLIFFKEYDLLKNFVSYSSNIISNASDEYKYILNSILNFFDYQLPRIQLSKKVLFGVLNYQLPSRLISSNIGDYIQTIAMLGQIINAGTKFSDATTSNFKILKKIQNYSLANSIYDVDVIPINRDYINPNIQLLKSEVWLPFYGWISHSRFDRSNDIILPKNVNPLFISVHISRYSVLSENNLKIFKQYEPIGCRDYNTVRILRSSGVRAFFSGCVTATLGELYKRNTPNSLKFASAHKESSINPTSNEIFVCHDIKNLLYMNFNDCLSIADSLLSRYVNAEYVRTNLLHAYMPCRGMSVPVTWSMDDSGDRRFRSEEHTSELQSLRHIV